MLLYNEGVGVTMRVVLGMHASAMEVRTSMGSRFYLFMCHFPKRMQIGSHWQTWQEARGTCTLFLWVGPSCQQHWSSVAVSWQPLARR